MYRVFGNHDYDVYSFNRNNVNYNIGESVIEYLKSNGTIKILRNENVIINDIVIIGLDLYWTNLRDIKKALTNNSSEFKILFAHNQNDLEINEEIANVYLFGHTHCG